MADNSNLLLLGGLAVGGYFLYSYLTGLPSDAAYVGALTSGQTATLGGQSFTGPTYLYYSPSSNKFYSNSTAPTATQTAAGQKLAGGSAGSTAAAPSTTQTPTGTVTTVASQTTGNPATATSGPTASSLESMYTQIITQAAPDPNFTGSGDAMAGTPYHWNVYLALVLPTGDATPDLGTVFPGVDLTQPMTAATYWAGMGPAIGKAYGLSGYGIRAGLGAYLRGHGWRAA